MPQVSPVQQRPVLINPNHIRQFSTVATVATVFFLLMLADSAEAGFWGKIGHGLATATKATGGALKKVAVVTGKAVAEGTMVFADRFLEALIRSGVGVEVNIPLRD